MSNTKIEWCQNPDGTKGMTWNPITGCTPISAGCGNCYAKRMARRQQAMGNYPNGFDVTFHPDRLKRPLRWKKPRTIFVDSMGDLFHKDVPYEWLNQVYDIINRCLQHTFQILTKRPDPMARYHEKLIKNNIGLPGLPTSVPWPLPNLWLGVTAEGQKSADERIPSLTQIPAALRFVSHEPLLEYIKPRTYPQFALPSAPPLPPIDWVIIGPETGPGRRICRPEWIQRLVNDYDAMRIPIFVKAFPLADGRISKNMDEWPPWAQRQEFPK